MTRVGIIGAGPAGLVAAKSCLENGLEPVIYETGDRGGGLWRGSGLAWAGLRTNLSRWSCMFSDFPWADGADIFPTQAAMNGYLSAYAARFGLNERIRFGVRVTAAHPCKAGWNVTTVGAAGTITAPVDRLIVASGFFAKPFRPAIPGEENFTGRVLHAGELRDPAHVKDARVTVVGGSFSGYELAAALALRGARVTHVLRHPSWLLSRFDPVRRVPVDLLLYRRKGAGAGQPPSFAAANRLKAEFLQAVYGNPGAAHPALALDPAAGVPVYAAISDRYPDLVRAGKIAVQVAEPHSFSASRLRLGNGAELEAGTVILATGYASALDFFDASVQTRLAYEPADRFMPLPLHQATWPDLQNLGFVGFYKGPYFGTMELQARWLAAVWSGTCEPPPQRQLAAGIAAAASLRTRWPPEQFPYADYIGLCDSFAAALGIGTESATGQPVIASHYRFTGPHARPGTARQVIASLPQTGAPR